MPTSMLTGNALTVKLWEIESFLNSYKSSAYGNMMRRGTIMRAAELDNARAGDETTFGFTNILTGVGTLEGGTQTGNEESLDLQSFKMKYNVLRHAVVSPNEYTIEQARTYIPFEERSRTQLAGWQASRMDASVFNQLAGVNSTTITVDTTVYSGSNRTIVQGLNDINAPTANRIIRAAGAATDEAITSSDLFRLDLIDAAVELLQRTYPDVEPLENEEFDLYISPEQMTDMKRDSSGKVQWYTNYLSAMEGGRIDENPIMNTNHYTIRPVGKYANVNIYSRNRVAFGQNSSTSAALPNVRRAVLCGKEAMGFASSFSGALEDLSPQTGTDGNVPLKFFTQLKDYEYLKGIEARLIYGVKKLQFDSEDNGSCVIATYAGPHTS